MATREIVLPETKPETEWIDGHAVRKVSPTYRHALLQRRIVSRLGTWADDNATGRVGTEWRFRIAPPDDVVRPLVPDIAYVSYDALPRTAAPGDIATPLGAPTVAIEILSPSDRKRHVASKIRTLLAAGTLAVVAIALTLIRSAIDARRRAE